MLDARPALKFPGMELIDCIELPILIIERDLTVARFNTAAAKLLSLSASDYGRHLHSVRKPAGTQQLEELCEHVIATGSSHRVEVADGEGSRFSINVGCHKADQHIHGAVLTFTNVTAFRESLERAIEEREFTKVVLNTIADGLVIVDSDLRIQAANQAFYALFQTSRQESQGAHLYHLRNGASDIPDLRRLLDSSSSPNDYPESVECDLEFPGVGRRTLWLNARPLTRGTHSELTTLITIPDVTKRKRAMEALRESEEELRILDRVGATLSLRTGSEEAGAGNHRCEPGIEPSGVRGVFLQRHGSDGREISPLHSFRCARGGVQKFPHAAQYPGIWAHFSR